MPELHDMSAHALRGLLDNRTISSRELTQAYLERIHALEPSLHAFITVAAEDALRMADEADRIIEAGQSLPWTGIPVALKDNLCTCGMPTTCGSRILDGFVPPYDAHVVERLRAQHAVFLGKLNMDEFAMGSSTENSAMGVTRNPWDTSRVPGGSSGGSAAAVAAGMCAAALGSDTGGSIRQPASYCGVVGMKPTYGRVSRYGLVAYASSLDQIGPVTRSVQDCAAMLRALCGKDQRDSTSVDLPADDLDRLPSEALKGCRIGLPKEYFGAGVAEPVRQSVLDAARLMEAQGATLMDISLPCTDYGLACYYVLAPSEASSNLARYDGVKYGYRAAHSGGHTDLTEQSRAEGFGDEVKQRIMIGTYALSAGYYDAFYVKAQKVRTLIRQEFDRAFEAVDMLVTPTAPTTAFLIGQNADDPLAMKLNDVCTIPVNIAGLPAISAPCGLADGLPVGVQMIGRPWEERSLCAYALAYEQARGAFPAPPI